MSYSNAKITQADINENNVRSASDILIGNADDNKAVFDKLPEFIAGKHNELIDELESQHGEEIQAAVNEWLAEHPEATTTVEDYSLTNKKLVKGTLGYVTPSMFDAIENGVCNIEKFQSMVDYAIEKHLNIKLDSDFDFNFVATSTIDNPTRILIKNCDSMVFDGDGHKVTMKGLTKDYLFSINDEATSGRDIFTFISFVLCNNITVKNLNVEGEYTFDSTYDFRFQSPRAKAVGFFGSYYCKVENCNFNGIFGNGVNFTPSSNARDGAWRNCNYCTVVKCHASNTLENGFNNMGNTLYISYIDVACYRCKGGIETGLGVSTITQSYFINCKSAFALGGQDTVSDVYVEDCYVYLNSSKILNISNSTFILNGMFYLIPDSKVNVNNCIFIKSDAAEWQSQYNYILYAVGTAAKAKMEVYLSNCRFDMKNYPIMVNWCKNLIINACSLMTDSGNVIIDYNTENFIVTSTIYNGGIAGTFTNDNVRIS